MRDFTFHVPTEFVFGKGVTSEVGHRLAQAGMNNVLLVYGRGSAERSGLLDKVRTSLEEGLIASVELGGVRPNPEVNLVREGIALAREKGANGVLAVGGGSVIDTAKAIAFGVLYPGDVWDIFTKKAGITRTLPVASVLTIPAAGSEASDSCVVSNDAEMRKVGVNSGLIRPVLAFMDPENTFSLPAYQTAAGVTDMVAHICERYFSGAEAVPVTDNIACGIIRALVQVAPHAIEQPRDYDARANIMWAGMLAHVGIAGCGRSTVFGKRAGGWESHALEHELSAHHPEIAHGAGLAVMMPAWMRYVWRENPERFLSFAHDVFGLVPAGETDEATEATVLAGIDKLQGFFGSLGMPTTLAELGVSEDELDSLLATLVQNKGESFGDLKKLTADDAREIYRSAL